MDQHLVEKQVEAKDSRSGRVGYRFEPRTLDEAIRISELISTSSIIPTRYQGRPGDILVATGYGAELGLSFLQSLQAVIVLNGTPTVWGDHALGLIKASGLLEWIDETFDESSKTATCKVKRKNEAKDTQREFSVIDAERAGLLNKTPAWRSYPARMLAMRARGFALRDTFPDVLRGIYLTEEVDSPESEQVSVEIQPPDGPATRVETIEMPRSLATVANPEKDAGTRESVAKDAEPEVESSGTNPGSMTADVARRVGVVEKVTKRALSTGDVFSVHLRCADSTDPIFIRTLDRAVAEIAHNSRGKQVAVTDEEDHDLGRRLISIAMHLDA